MSMYHCIIAVKISRRHIYAPAKHPSILKISASHHAESGVGTMENDLVMYRRPSFEEQVLFFKEQIVERGVLGWIIGPPGTGKSATSFAFVSSLDSNAWTVVWVHLTRSGYSSVVIFEDEEEARFRCSEETVAALLDEMKHRTSDKKTFLVIDGYFREGSAHNSILGRAMNWRYINTLKHRLAVVSSMSTRGKVNYADDNANKVLEFRVYSWTREEYLQAITCEDFVQSVLVFLDSIAAGGFPTNEEMVDEKFLVAGGCAQYMFGMCTADVKESIKEAIASLEYSPSTNILSAGQRSGTVINRLFSQYKNLVGKSVSTFVSQFAETEIALKKGPAAVKELFRLTRQSTSGSTAGGLFEAIFFLRMRCDGISLKCKNGTTVTLKAADFQDYADDMVTISYPGRLLWLRPVLENQVGFDAVYIDKDARFARFFQLARGPTHSFKMNGCNILLSRLHDCRVEVVEFCFVVRDELLHSFKISGGKKITGRGCLSDYKVAGQERRWEHGMEEHDAVIVAMDDII